MSTRARPLLGLSTYRETAAWGAWNLPVNLLPATYAAAVRTAGGLPLLLPPGAAEPKDEAVELVTQLDGLILTGGPDVDPRRYGAEPEEHTDAARPDRDEWEIALVHAALSIDLPVLAICRGLQVLNVALGGTLHQHLPVALGHEGHRGTVGSFVPHVVHFESDSMLATLYPHPIDVPTHHHQGIDRLGDGLVAIGWTEDGLIEAVTLPGQRWLVGVQWHPEQSGGAQLFARLVDAAQSRRA